MPAARLDRLRIGRRLDLLLLCPGQFFLGAITATVLPAILGVVAAADVVLTDERLAVVLYLENTHGKADGRGDVGKQNHARTKTVRDT